MNTEMPSKDLLPASRAPWRRTPRVRPLGIRPLGIVALASAIAIAGSSHVAGLSGPGGSSRVDDRSQDDELLQVGGWSQIGGWDEPDGGQVIDAQVAFDAPVQAGERITVAVHVDGATALAAWEAGLRFDPGLVLPAGVQLGDFAPAGSTLLQESASPGGRLAIGGYNAAGQAATGSGTLAVVTFEAVAAGQAEITLDPVATSAFDKVGQPLTATVALRRPSGSIYLPRLSNGEE